MLNKRLIVTAIIVLFLYVGMSFVTDRDVDRSLGQLFSDVQSWVRDDMLQGDALVVPKLPENIQSQAYYEDHWQGDLGFFVLLSEEVVSKKAPEILSSDYETVFKAQRVRLLYEKSHDDDIDGEFRRWVFIASEQGNTYLGWMFKDQLVFPHQFKRLDKPSFKGFLYEKGEFQATVKVGFKGQFKQDWHSEGQGLFLKGKKSGQLYDYNDLIWAKKDDQDFLHEFFILDDQLHLMQEYRFQLDPITMNIYTFPKK